MRDDQFLLAVGVMVAALAIWLTVRIVNRRERWAQRVAVGLFFGLPILYLASFGPACWWMAATVQEVPGGPRVGSNAAYVSQAYWPIGWAVDRYRSIRPLVAWYSRLFGARSGVLLPVKGRGSEGTILWLKKAP
jgi:hypothetical protein